MRLVMASANPNKVAEIAELLADYDIEPRPPEMGDIPEHEQTLEGNARLKAAAVCREANAAAEECRGCEALDTQEKTRRTRRIYSNC